MPGPQLDVDSRKGRYGVAYLDAIATAAGYDTTEPRPGADALAYDVTLRFPEGYVSVQVKTTHSYAIAGTNPRLTYTAEQHWVDSWSVAKCPVYFLVVVVPRAEDDDDDVSASWLRHHDGGTDLLGTAAYWSRIDASQFSPGNMAVAALRNQRFDASVFPTWRQDLRDSYGPQP